MSEKRIVGTKRTNNLTECLRTHSWEQVSNLENPKSIDYCPQCHAIILSHKKKHATEIWVTIEYSRYFLGDERT